MVVFVFAPLGFGGTTIAFAATTPSLGMADGFVVLADTYTNTVPGTSVIGDLGYTTAPLVMPALLGTTHVADGTYAQAGIDQGLALADLNSQPCVSLGAGAVALDSVVVGLNPPGTFTPGCYSSGGAMDITLSTTVTLNGVGTYIFRPGGALNTGANSIVKVIGGASACDVFWTPTATTLGANSTFLGTVIDGGGITVGGNTNWTGRALAFGKTVTTAVDDTISKPVCAPTTGTLNIIKTVINDDGGVATASSFNLHVKLGGVEVASSPAVGVVSPGRAYILNAGTYVVSEDTNASYTQSFSGDCNSSGSVNLTAGSTKTCTITNNDVAIVPPTTGTLNIIKTVINDDGGVATASSFNLHVKLGGVEVASSPAVGVVTPGRAYTLTADTYVVSEDANALYTQSFSGDCNSSGSVSLTAGSTKTCTITNNDVAIVPPISTINVVKIVVNDNNGNKTVADFPLFVNGTLVVSGVTNTFPAPATYTVTETSNANYTQAFSGDCSSTGVINLATGNSKFCIITNNDIAPIGIPGGSGNTVYASTVPPIIDLVKIPDPLALPDGPGLVNYSYTLRNIGTVPVSNITMVGDSCSPIKLASGDINSDAKLDVNETWVYRCATTLTETHTNTVVATGWANSLSATDIASATVVVGLPVVAPLIHITKIPSPLALFNGPGMVTYTKKITNPGTVALSNVVVSDDKCSPVQYVSGDANDDDKLDPSETWTYTCRHNIDQTTTNVATASGEANGLIARDLAFATVVVSNAIPVTGQVLGVKVAGVTAATVPGFPKTGLPPVEQNTPWSLIIIAGVLMIVSTSLVVVLKKSRV
jgi:uncharacterized repeat protein (TIGR01451 family)